MPHSPEYEEALEFERQELKRKYREEMALRIATEVFGGTPEQIEETRKLLLEDKNASS